MKNKTFKITHTICMMYFGSFFAGIINGLFASGAGQIIVFVLVFVLKLDTHISRATSVFCVGSVTILTLFRYLPNVDLKLNTVLIVGCIGITFGVIGAKIMQKIPSNYLNLISGLIVFGFAIYNILRG